MTKELKRISFLFHPNDIDHKNHVVEKADSEGRKRRYLKGITSGTKIDGHGERITQKCIKSFHEQASSGDILLYADKHGVAYTDDLGILTESSITPMGEWETEFRLYDQYDDVGQNTLERSDTLWKQINGFPPYKKPKQKGFSIEGYIPDNGILAMDNDGKRVIDDVILDGVVCVPRPAYKTSVAQALYKALDEIPPWKIEKANENAFKKNLITDDLKNNYYRSRYLYQDRLEEQIDIIMGNDDISDKEQLLKNLFSEYSDAMIDLIMESDSVFDKLQSNSEDAEETADLYSSPNVDNKAIIKSMISNLDTIISKLN